MSRSDSNLPSDPKCARRRIPLSVFSLRPNTHTARPHPEVAHQPPAGSRRNLARWLLAASGFCTAAAAAIVFLKPLAPTHDDARLTHIESTSTGRAQTKTSETGSELKWRDREVVVAIDDSVDELGPGAREAVQSAFASWLDTGAELPRLRFESTRGKKPSERPDGVNTVMFAPIHLDGHKNDVAITLTFSDPKTGEIVEADIVINAKHPFAVLGPPAGEKPRSDDDEDRDDDWADDDGTEREENSAGQHVAEGASARSCGPATTSGAECGRAYDLENAAAHEVGHFFGLGEDVEDHKSSMYQCISRCEVQKRTLETGDRQAAVGLYVGSAAVTAPEEAGAAGCSGARIGRALPARGAALSFALALGMAGLAVRRGRRRESRAGRSR